MSHLTEPCGICGNSTLLEVTRLEQHPTRAGNTVEIVIVQSLCDTCGANLITEAQSIVNQKTFSEAEKKVDRKEPA